MPNMTDTATPLPPHSKSLRSRFDYATTVERFAAELHKRSIELFVQLDQAAKAEAVGLKLRPTCFFLFGNPAVGTHVMAANARAALDLPLRAVVWEASDGGVHLDFVDVKAMLAKPYSISDALLKFAAPTESMMRVIAGIDE